MIVLHFKKYADLQDHGSWTMPEAVKAIVEENLEGRKKVKLKKKKKKTFIPNWPVSKEKFKKSSKSPRNKFLKNLTWRSQKSFAIAKMSAIWPNHNILSSSFLQTSLFL